MKKRVLTALAVLSVVFGTVSIVSTADAYYAPNGRHMTWHDGSNG